MIETPWKGRSTAEERRHRMVERQLRARGIRDERVLDAMDTVPRDRFLPPHKAGAAYQDRAVPIGDGQTISQPYMVAAMTEALRLGPDDRVLEVGTGSGYQAAVLAHLAGHVYSVERLEKLADEARTRLRELGIDNVSLRVGDGTLGWAQEAPFDAILVTAAAPAVPPALTEQLVDGGRLVAPVGDRALQDVVLWTRKGDEFEKEILMGARFVPLLGEEGW